ARFTVSLMLPLPLAVKPEAPPLPTAVKVSLPTLAGRMSLTVAPVTLLGPLLLTTIVYVVEVPGVTVTTPSVLVIERSATRLTVSLSVALLLPGVRSVTPTGAAMVAVLAMEPVALPATVALTVNVAVPPLSKFTLAEMLPLPLAGQLEPTLATQLQLPNVRPAGAVSVTVAPVAALGPLFVATMLEIE